MALSEERRDYMREYMRQYRQKTGPGRAKFRMKQFAKSAGNRSSLAKFQLETIRRGQAKRIESRLKAKHSKYQGIAKILGKGHPKFKEAERRSARAFTRLQRLKSRNPQFFVKGGGK